MKIPGKAPQSFGRQLSSLSDGSSHGDCVKPHGAGSALFRHRVKSPAFKKNPAGDLVSISHALKDFFATGANAPADHLFAIKLWKLWPRLIPDDAFKDSRPVSFEQGRLTLWVTSAAEMQEIHLHTEQLKKNINQYFKSNKVQSVYFTFNRDILSRRKMAIESGHFSF